MIIKKTFYKIISYISLFAFLLSINACITTEQYSDTPEKIFSGESDLDLKALYSLDSISLKNKRTLKLNNNIINFTERQKEKYLLYYNPKGSFIDSALMKETNSKILLYKKPVADTLNFKSIDSMYFSRSKTDVSYAILGAVIGIPLALFFGGWLYAKSIREHK